MISNPITGYEALSYALHLLLEGKAHVAHSERLPVTDGRKRAMIGGGNVTRALLEAGLEDRPGGYRCRISIPEYVKGQGFVPLNEYAMFEVYDAEYAPVYGPTRLEDLSGYLGFAVQAAILETLRDAALRRAPKLEVQ